MVEHQACRRREGPENPAPSRADILELATDRRTHVERITCVVCRGDEECQWSEAQIVDVLVQDREMLQASTERVPDRAVSSMHQGWSADVVNPEHVIHESGRIAPCDLSPNDALGNVRCAYFRERVLAQYLRAVKAPLLARDVKAVMNLERVRIGHGVREPRSEERRVG